MIRQRSATGEGETGTTKGTVRFCPVRSRYGAVSAVSVSEESDPRKVAVSALFRPTTGLSL